MELFKQMSIVRFVDLLRDKMGKTVKLMSLGETTEKNCVSAVVMYEGQGYRVTLENEFLEKFASYEVDGTDIAEKIKEQILKERTAGDEGEQI